MEKYIQELRERYEGIQSSLTDREIILLDTMRYVSNSQCTVDRNLVISNLRKGLGAHYPVSVYITNKGSNQELPNLELREVFNLIQKLEYWKVVYIPKFGIPIWSLNIFGGPKTKDFEFFGAIIEVEPKNIKKIKLAHLWEIIEGQEVMYSRA